MGSSRDTKTTTAKTRRLRVAGVNGADIQVVDYVEAEMTILGRKTKRPFLVVKGLSTTEAILSY
jgi:hypothetical protein